MFFSEYEIVIKSGVKTMKNVVKKAVIYARQSSGKEEESESIEMQKQHCMEIAENYHLDVVGIYEDSNCSGRLYPTGMEDLEKQDIAMKKWYRTHTTDKRGRPGLGKVFEALPGLSYVIVDDLTRLARPVPGSFLQNVIQQRLVENHVKVLTVKDGEVDYEDFCDRLMSDIQSSITDNQIRIQGQKSKDALRKLRDDGIYPTMPRMFGIRYSSGSKIVDVDPKSAECIKYIYGEILKCRPYNAITAEVNARYAELFEGTCHPSTFKHIATQPFYCGYMYDSNHNLIRAKQMEGKEVISYETWSSVQDILNLKRGANPRAQFRQHPFTGLLYCGSCGAKLVSGFDNGKEFYYCCAGSNSRKNQKCRESRININLVRPSEFYTGLKISLTPVLLLALFKYLDDKQMTTTDLKNLATYESQLKEKERLLENGLKIYTEAGIRENDLKRLAQKAQVDIDKLREKIAKLKILEKSDVTKQKFYKMCIGRFEQLLNGELEDGDYEFLLRQSVKRIDVFKDYLMVDTVYGSFRLDRFMMFKFRNMPKFTWQKKAETENEKDLSKCIIEITYIYEKDGCKKLNVDLGKMKIYEKK